MMGNLLVILLFVSAFLLGGCGDKEPGPMPTLLIMSNEGISDKTKSDCKLFYKTGSEEIPFQAAIKRRGGMSMRYQKHSYTVNLKGKFPFCDLPIDDDWILNANYIDKTFMRHKISYDLFRQMGKHNIAPRCAYVNVELNNAYQGLYLIMEKMDASTLGINRSDSLAMIFKDPHVFYQTPIQHPQDSLNYFHQKFPKITAFDKTRHIKKFQDFLFYSSDRQFAKQIALQVDLANIMDWHLLLLFSNNSDGIMKNFYLYKKDSSAPYRIAIWDYDHSFGRDGDNELNFMKSELDPKRSVLLKRLMEIELLQYNNRLKTRWAELRKNGIMSLKNFVALIRGNHKTITGQLSQNFQLWPVNSKWYHDDNTYAEEIDLMVRFVEFRIAQLDERFGYPLTSAHPH